MIVTSPTPASDSSSRFSFLSASSVTSRTFPGPETTIVRIGVASGSTLMTVGRSAPCGSFSRTALTFSLTSCAAMLTSFSRTNVTNTRLRPSTDVLRSSSMPLTVLIDSSSLSETSVSTCSGAAPGTIVVTVTTGKSIFGKRSMPSFRYEKRPMTVSKRAMTVAKMGRLTQMAASHCMADVPSW